MRRLSSLLVLVIVAGVVAAAYALHVDQVRVTGLRTLSAADVIRASGVEPGQRILWIRLSAAARRVERIPAVERATATRSLPGTVVIHITERRAIAKLASTPDLVSDPEGHVFAETKMKGLPTLDGWRPKKGSRRELDAATRAVLHAYSAFPDALRKQTQRIVVRPLFALRLARGIEVRFGRLDHLAEKAAAAVAVLRAEGSKPVAYIDVQAPTVPVVGAIPTTTPAPTPTPAPTAAVVPQPAATVAPQTTSGH